MNRFSEGGGATSLRALSSLLAALILLMTKVMHVLHLTISWSKRFQASLTAFQNQFHFTGLGGMLANASQSNLRYRKKCHNNQSEK